MRIYTLSHREIVPKPIEEVFEFFSQPENLGKLTPKGMRFEILTPTPIPMHAGSVIDYILRPLWLPMRWTTVITQFDPPNKFSDVQLYGPYAYWHHQHHFSPVPGGTLIRDEVRYAIPFGLLGRMAHFLWVKRQLREIFSFRAKQILKIFGTAVSSLP